MTRLADHNCKRAAILMKERMPALFIVKRIRLPRVHDNSSDNRNFLLGRSRFQWLQLLDDLHHLYERAEVSFQRIVEAHLRGRDNLGNVTKSIRILDTD